MARWGIAALLLALAGCGPWREVPVAEPVATVEDSGVPSSALAHPRTRAWMRRLCAKREPEVGLGIVRARPQLPRLTMILEQHGLPAELVAVPAVESRFLPQARGHAGELGIWQLRPATARRFGLQVNRRHDERTHIERSTQAAARYLAFLHARYDDWLLALAAYNAGEARVDRALAQRPGATFWELAAHGALPRISRDYVPKVLAVMRLTTSSDGCASA